jgi:hypothetical protein
MDTFDFGFTLVDEEELAVTKELKNVELTASNDVTALQKKVDDLYNAIKPLLNNLTQNPEKEYILWPNRVEKVKEFEMYLQNIYTK